MKLFLLVGQSNMSGRGHFNEVPPIHDKRCFVMRNGHFRTMSEPIAFDQPVFAKLHSGTSLAASFAVRCADYLGEAIGLIPCSDGGSSLEKWKVGGLLYDHAVMMARLGLRTAEIAGILWHQGESDCGSCEMAESYAERFGVIIEQMQKDIGVRPPLVIGELGHYLSTREKSPYWHIVNEQLHAYAASHENCAIATAEGLLPNEDNLHFCSAALREYGNRYFEKYKELVER